MRLLRREICCLQHRETESNVWNTFVWSCPTWPSRWGMHISIDWPRLKSCQAVCDECTRGEIYSSLSRDAGCLAVWSWRESCVTKIWGSGAWSRIRVISFRYHGFPYSTIGDFLDPNIRVIRGPYCMFMLPLINLARNGLIKEKPRLCAVTENNLWMLWICISTAYFNHEKHNCIP